MPQPLCLFRERGNHMRVTVTEAGYGDAAGKIEKFATVGRINVGTFAPIDGNIPPTIGRHYGWNHGNLSCATGLGNSAGILVYRRRRFPAGAILRTHPERRLSWPGLRIIGTLLASGRPVHRPLPHPGKRRSMRTANGAVNSRKERVARFHDGERGNARSCRGPQSRIASVITRRCTCSDSAAKISPLD